jgi:hypothetical protein
MARGRIVNHAQATSKYAQVKMTRHTCCHLVDAHCAIDLNDMQLQGGRLCYYLVCEVLVADEEIR